MLLQRAYNISRNTSSIHIFIQQVTTRTLSLSTPKHQTPSASTQELKQNLTSKASAQTQTKEPKATVVEVAKKQKTMAELDAELREKMEGRAGDGGEAGVELENGKAVAMKRGVKENMFRVI